MNTESKGELIQPGEATATELREAVESGQWYWVTSWDQDKQAYEWLGCVTRIGSNFVELSSIGQSRTRVHDDNLTARLRPAPDAAEHIAGKVDHYSREAKRIICEMHDLTRALGVGITPAIGKARPKGSGQELAVLSGTVDTDRYKADLIAAKKTLPALEKALRDNNERLVRWMNAELLPLLADKLNTRESLEAIESRIFNVSLYAGLGEDLVQCLEGKPAPMSEPLRVMQRRLYMDEECLLGYRHGGMDFQTIGAFDSWLCEPENLNRILPFERCMVAMRVRRTPKEYGENGAVINPYVQMQMDMANRATYLYVRNGGNVYRLITDLELGEMIFPDRAEFDPSQPMMAEMFVDSVRRVITAGEFEQMVAKDEAKVRSRQHYKDWLAENPANADIPIQDYPGYRRGSSMRMSDWYPFDQSCVYYDDIAAFLASDFERYNRIALLIQGLFDRSTALHPHPKVEVWNPASFGTAIELIYDSERALYAGEKPDFEAYRARLNASLREGSMTVGQDEVWERREADREYERGCRNWRIGEPRHCGRLRPLGDPGPGAVARIERWMPRAMRATYSWTRERRSATYSYLAEDRVRETIMVDAKDLLNVDAYQLGDYRQFFADPRTRAEYLKWAPLLLEAEEYVAKRQAQQT